MRRRYVTLNVFTLRRFAGNPLAVVFEPEGLDTAAMQTIAREFNYPETVFVLPAQDKAHRARLRIFTPALELPFAGHPTVGTAVALARGGDKRQSFIVAETVGPVPCEVSLRDADSGEASFELPRLPAEGGKAPDVAAMAAALGLDPQDIGGGLAPAVWSAGLGYTFVPVKNLAAIAKAGPDLRHFEKTFAIGGDHGAAYLFCREVNDAGSDFHARMFAPAGGIHEDPATGSAAAGFAGLLAAQAGFADGTHRVRIEQGYEMGRPSQIDLTVEIEGGKLIRGSIGGGAVIVCEGHIEA